MPEGAEAGKLKFPTPHLIPFGELNTYGYEEPILVTSHIRLAEPIQKGQNYDFQADVSWVVCDDKTCVPESASVTLQLRGSSEGQINPNFEKFQHSFAKPALWRTEFNIQSGQLTVVIEPEEELGALSQPYLFIENKGLARYGYQHFSFTPAGLTFVMDAGSAEVVDIARMILSYQQNGEAHAVELQAKRVNEFASSAATAGFVEVVLGIAAAFVGGLILNLMPCVFPILSMKALSLVHASHSNQSTARQSAWFYTLGIVLSFIAIALALIVMREAGQSLGWGFQMQSPWVNLGLSLLMLTIALNLFGLFEIGTQMAGVGQSLVKGGERRTSFFTGLLAVVVATPCTAPFMASALAFALAQPAYIAVMIFIGLGLGLAFPYLLLSYIPNLGRFLPKPGAWMDNFKKILAFPMCAAAVWLLWVMGQQLGVSSMAAGLMTALCLSLTLWLYGQSTRSGQSKRWLVAAFGALVLTGCIASTIEDYKAVPGASAEAASHKLGKLPVENFNPERLARYVSEQKAVFVYFTADWCVSCKVNERVALATDEVTGMFSEKGIQVVRGDWTAEDPLITEWLAKYNRVGVPLYLYFAPGATLDTPHVFTAAFATRSGLGCY